MDQTFSMDSSIEPGKSVRVVTFLEKRLLVLVALLLVTGMGLIIGIIHLQHSNNETSGNLKESPPAINRCFTPTCISEAANFLQSMNTSVNPCTDFYSFACGNWIKNSYLVSSRETQFTKMAKTINLRVKEILEELQGKYLPSNKQKIAHFYEACMDKSQRDELGAHELVSDLEEFGGWPLMDEDWKVSDFDWSQLMIQLFKNGYISDMLFKIKVDVDVKNTSKSILVVDQPSLGLIKRRRYDILLYENLLHSYKFVLSTLASLLRGDIDEKTMKYIEEAFELEDKIAHAKEYVDMRYPDTFYNIMTLEELDSFAPKIPWRKLFGSLLPPGNSITNDEWIMVTSLSYIEDLNNILEEMDNGNGRKILANYMFYRVVFDAAQYLSKPYYNLVSELFESASVGPPMPWEVCAKTTLELLPLPLTASYVKRYTNSKTKEVLGTMVENIRNSIVDGIGNTDWLDTETKRKALWKVKNIKSAIGYEEEIMNDDNLDQYYKNVTITYNHFRNVKHVTAFRLRQSMEGLHEKRDANGWIDDYLLTANAYYKSTANTIAIPIGVLQDTVFATDRPNYINYGSLGMIVGHELTHAFDSIGSLYDAEGNYRNWWSNESWENFEEKKECFKEQYNNYYVPEASDYVNGAQTLAENIADNGGLKAAYYAYNTLLSKIGSEKSLPGLQYNEKQMFWISFASVWCRKQTDKSIQYILKHDAHTVAKFRVIGSLSNTQEFSEDFNCKLHSTMNPSWKCSLWK